MSEFLLIERFDRLPSFDLESLKRGKRFTGFVAKDSEKKNTSFMRETFSKE